MRVNAEFINTDAVNVTLTITMTMGEWKAIREALPTKWPSWKLGQAIGQVITKLESNVDGFEDQD